MSRRVIIAQPLVSVIEAPPTPIQEQPPPQTHTRVLPGRTEEEIREAYGGAIPEDTQFRNIVADCIQHGFGIGGVVVLKQQEGRQHLYKPDNWGIITHLHTVKPVTEAYKPLKVNWTTTQKLAANYYGNRSSHFRTELILVIPAPPKQVLWENINRPFLTGSA